MVINAYEPFSNELALTLKLTRDRVDVLSSHKERCELSLVLLGDRLEAVARIHEDAIAVVDGQRRMSYRELLLRADALARELEARGIGPRDLVGIALPRSAELVVAVVGVVRAGAAYVPIDVNQPAERCALILSDAHPKLVVTEGAQFDGIPLGIEVLRLPQYVPETIERRRRPVLEDPVYVIYTSGSTGQPKGVVVTQRNAARLFTITEPLFKFDANDVWALFHSIGFDVSVWELWGALLHGGRLVVVPALTARAAACIVPKSKDYSAPELRRLLIRHATERLPPYMLPTTIQFLHELPRKPNGKLDLTALEDAKHDSTPSWGDAPLSSVESRILGIMRDVLRHEDLGPDDDFFERGGDSLLAITLMLRLDSEFGRELPAHVMDGAFTLRRLAAILESPSVLRATYPAGVVGIRAGTTDKSLFCLPGLDGTAFQFRTLAAKMSTRRPILAIELHNLKVGPSVLETIEGTAEAVVERMREVQPVGPYAILGYSFGGNLAVEVAKQLNN